MIGAGPVSADGWRRTPVYTVGAEYAPARSRVAWRLSAERWEFLAEPPLSCSPCTYHHARSMGAQFLGVRNLGSRRVQPYLLAGVGVYARRDDGIRWRLVPTDSGLWWGDPHWYDDTEVTPSLTWGVGANVRIPGARLFGEVKLPWYYDGSFHHGPDAPLLIGVKF